MPVEQYNVQLIHSLKLVYHDNSVMIKLQLVPPKWREGLIVNLFKRAIERILVIIGA